MVRVPEWLLATSLGDVQSNKMTNVESLAVLRQFREFTLK